MTIQLRVVSLYIFKEFGTVPIILDIIKETMNKNYGKFIYEKALTNKCIVKPFTLNIVKAVMDIIHSQQTCSCYLSHCCPLT